MNCNCGGNTEGVNKVVRDKELQGEFQTCPNCGRIKWLWASNKLQDEIGVIDGSYCQNRTMNKIN